MVGWGESTELTQLLRRRSSSDSAVCDQAALLKRFEIENKQIQTILKHFKFQIQSSSGKQTLQFKAFLALNHLQVLSFKINSKTSGVRTHFSPTKPKYPYR